ncbi:SCO0930 family lipoprotein [Streptomyces sp. NBC_00091]|uniref:SCO0930 family lipoprotein n=1 Tax=Streptomyces sp. NBC_00091 TaxID=2975648 RepID=UPI00225571D1|nr:SCO0930 family lipoprotein [Streptomyces sp. NBC_00091]MCX5381581.1 SCO0930 family lipoprotein [Streptomyces sp. NBC_00091]
MRREIIAGSAVAVLLLTAGCGIAEKPASKANAVQPAGAGKQLDGYGSAPGSGYGSGSGYGEGSGASPAGGAAQSGAAGELKVREVPDLGSAVTDGEGFTLYRFDKDTAKPPKSNCEGDCAKAWPVVPADGATAGAGVDAALFGSVTRADGSKQLTVGGWPVYRYAKDTKAGDTLGEGVGGTWHVLGPDGKPAGAGKGTGTDTGKPGQEQEKEQEGGAKEEAKTALSVRKNPQLGNIIQNAEGWTLYRFDKDSAWPMKIGCVDACTDAWKPAEPVDKSQVSGIDAKLVGLVKRPDGSEQLTIDCWPVYTFTGDKAPGDVNGQGKQGLWWAVTDKGKKAKAAG